MIAGIFPRLDCSVEKCLKGSQDDRAVVFVRRLLEDAVDNGASDVHIEPEKDKVRVRYSVDGTMRHVCFFGKSSWGLVSTRIKVVSGMDVAETSSPQSGRIAKDEHSYRVSSHPTIHGESFVVRVLYHRKARKLDQLGFCDSVRERLRLISEKESGMLIITGPTNSGKTTTAHSILSEKRHEEKNVVTIEDPVEYTLDGARQSSVASEEDFAENIRSVLRQNPDILFIGEIRDKSSAELAFRATMAGTLVITTLHTKSALHAIQRLEDLGVGKNHIRENVTGILAQRLVRKTCCGNCPLCAESGGYRGRYVIGEFVEISDGIFEVLNSSDSVTKCKSRLCELGMSFIEESAANAIVAGNINCRSAISVI